MSLPVRVLFSEDTPGDALLVREELRLAAPRTAIQLEWVDRLETGLKSIAAHPFDAVLAYYSCSRRRPRRRRNQLAFDLPLHFA